MDGLDVSNGLPSPPVPGPNQVLAQRMGIVMGTSHHEPMTRNKEEWDQFGHGPWDWTNKEVLEEWWKYGAERAQGMETLFTVGMRGDGDLPLTGGNSSVCLTIGRTELISVARGDNHCCATGYLERCVENQRSE